MDLRVEIFDRSESAIGEMMSFEVTPTAFDVVEFRGIFWQPLDSQPWPLGERFCREFAGVDRAVIEHHHDRFPGHAGARSALPVQFFQQADEVGTALGSAGEHCQFPSIGIKQAEHAALEALTRSLNSKVGSTLCPHMSEVRMRERFGFILEEQSNIARLRLLTQQIQPHARALDRLLVLTAVQSMPWPTPGKAPFLRSMILSRDIEMATPHRRSISAVRRGKVHKVCPGSSRITLAQAKAASPLVPGRPVRGLARRAFTPPEANRCLIWRTPSARMPITPPIISPLCPSRLQRIARARSASCLFDDRLSRISAIRSCALAVSLHFVPRIHAPYSIRHRDFECMRLICEVCLVRPERSILYKHMGYPFSSIISHNGNFTDFGGRWAIWRYVAGLALTACSSRR
jgi:hypothetical protein